MMKNTIQQVLVFSLLFQSVTYAIERIHQFSEGLDSPESTYVDDKSGYVYVSNVVGSGIEEDGVGWINRIDQATNKVDLKWIDGLNAPKGLRVHEGVLWVADFNTVRRFNLETKEALAPILIKDATFLNDIAIDSKTGVAYVSDTFLMRVLKIEDETVSVAVQNTGKLGEHTNGLLVRDGILYMANWGSGIHDDFTSDVLGTIQKWDLSQPTFKYVDGPKIGNLDGIEIDNDGTIYVSDWIGGKVYKIAPDGTQTLIIEGLKGAADLGLSQTRNRLWVPRMSENLVDVYQL